MVKYPRDPSLDPQLVWKGKDEQDSKDLEVPSVPIYIQEKIHPQALIEDLIKQQLKLKNQPDTKQASLDLFSDFNGLPPGFDNKVDFYHHEGHWSNRMILGDSLLVMNSLAEKEGLKGKVQMIYIDPPYGIRFGSNWQVSTRKNQVQDGRAEDASRQPEQVRAFRDTWELGIHSYLTYLRERLTISRDLLCESGSIFVQIGDENVHYVRTLIEEVFGRENFVAQIFFKTTTGRQESQIDRVGNYCIWFAKNLERVKSKKLFYNKETMEEDGISAGDLQSQGVRSTGSYRVTYRGVVYQPLSGNHWKVTEDGMNRLILAGRALPMRTVLRFLRYASDFPVVAVTDIWNDTSGGAGQDKIYAVQTSTKIIERCILLSTDPGDLILDPTCGSGTSAAVAEQWGRRWITIDTSRVALALARTRLMSTKYSFYTLADSMEGIEVEAKISGKRQSSYRPLEDVRKGFVYERVPHITLKSIANSEEIDVIHGKWQNDMEPLRETINKVSGRNYEEWEMPKEIGGDENLSSLLKNWWELRRRRQKEIDESIAKRAEMEILYDRPYEDRSRIRVSGPFTVESLSPHRVLPADDNLDGKVGENESKPFQDFTSMILENLKKAGIQNTKRKEKINFDSLEPYAGRWIQAIGTYTDMEHKQRKVGISIGPEFGTVSPHQVKEAAKEAVQGLGFDLLAICGFAFDPYVSEEAKTFGRLDVVPVKMNPDLAMGNELLKKTGSGNLFMIYGEPDLKIEKADGKMTIEVLGLDIYDPTTGQTRASSIDEIACWFIDTEYDGESFFVRHAYFTGGNDPYEKLRKTLRAEIDEAAWSSLYSAKSRPFPISLTGKVAVKVINHYGDEVVKVISLSIVGE
ncbi:MAG: site-specific DNA-methyltransferase, partial [Methanomassiliicoccales archaeon]